MKTANPPQSAVPCGPHAQNRAASTRFERPTGAIHLTDAAAPQRVAALPHCGAFESDLDWIAVEWTDCGIRRLTFGHPTADVALARWQSRTGPRAAPCSVPRALRQPLVQYAAGEVRDLRDVPVDLNGLTDFQRRVLQACRRIAYGTTLTYAQLARRAGAAAGAARAVGQVMARNPVPLIIPCHRVVGSAGALGGYSAPRGLAMKRRLLQLEQASD